MNGAKTVAGLLGLLLLVQPLAAEAADGTGVGGAGAAGELTLWAQRQLRGDAALAEREQVRSVVVGPVAVTTLVVACQGNGPGANAQTSLFCDASRLGCQGTPDPGDILYWRWPGTRFPDDTVVNGVAPAGTACVGPGQASAVELPELTLADFRRLPLPPGIAMVQPAGGRVLINVPTNVYVHAEPVVLDTTLVGLPVQVQATPADFTWTFGDGASLGPTRDPGAVYPDLRTTHSYTASGQYTIVLTTAYTGEFSVAGGPWLPVDGQAQVVSPGIAVTAVSGRNRLVAEPLAP